MAFTDSDFVAMNLPPGVTFAINGVTMTVASAIQNALDEKGTRAGALGMLYAMLESDNLQSETIGKYSYTKYQMRGSDYWKLQDAGSGMDATPPNVPIRPGRYGNGFGYGGGPF